MQEIVPRAACWARRPRTLRLLGLAGRPGAFDLRQCGELRGVKLDVETLLADDLDPGDLDRSLPVRDHSLPVRFVLVTNEPRWEDGQNSLDRPLEQV